MADDEEDLVCHGSGSESDFDMIVGYIEEIIIDPKFVEMQNQFMEEHYRSFEEGEENKLEYMDIFKAYTDSIEKYIETYLMKKIPEFSMKKFLQELISQELEGEAKNGVTPDLSIVTHNYCNGQPS